MIACYLFFMAMGGYIHLFCRCFYLILPDVNYIHDTGIFYFRRTSLYIIYDLRLKDFAYVLKKIQFEIKLSFISHKKVICVVIKVR